jgi:hypothetical protein
MTEYAAARHNQVNSVSHIAMACGGLVAVSAACRWMVAVGIDRREMRTVFLGYTAFGSRPQAAMKDRVAVPNPAPPTGVKRTSPRSHIAFRTRQTHRTVQHPGLPHYREAVNST